MTSTLRAVVATMATVGLSMGGLTACALFSPGPCTPMDPTVSPEEVKRGGDVRVTAHGLTTGECADSLPESAVYNIEVHTMDGQTDQVLGQFDPLSDGTGEGVFQIPQDFPVGDATIRIDVEGATLACETSESEECGNSWALVSVTG